MLSIGAVNGGLLDVEHTITDAAKFEEYGTNVGPMIAKHGGRYLTKAGANAFKTFSISSPNNLKPQSRSDRRDFVALRASVLFH
jgi:hypothetical protein